MTPTGNRQQLFTISCKARDLMPRIQAELDKRAKIQSNFVISCKASELTKQLREQFSKMELQGLI